MSAHALDTPERLAFYAKIDKGIEDVQAGRVKPLEEVVARLSAKYRAMAERT